MNKMYYLYKIPVTVLLTQELTSLHVVSSLKSDQRPQSGPCTQDDLLATSELPRERLGVLSLSSLSLDRRKLLTVFEYELPDHEALGDAVSQPPRS